RSGEITLTVQGEQPRQDPQVIGRQDDETDSRPGEPFSQPITIIYMFHLAFFTDDQLWYSSRGQPWLRAGAGSSRGKNRRESGRNAPTRPCSGAPWNRSKKTGRRRDRRNRRPARDGVRRPRAASGN